jgi:LPS sulfotransferase NodH
VPDGWRPGEAGAADHPARPGASDGADAGAAFVTVACTLRSGSNLLCEMLRLNGFGEPKEWFQPAAALAPGATQNIGADAALLERQTREFFAAHRASPWHGLKVDWPQFQRLRCHAPAVAAVAAVSRSVETGRWIYLTRRDLAAQAVSLYAAQLTGAWMGEDTADYERLPDDFDALHERFAALAADAFAWDMYFRDGGPTPLRVFQEDLLGGGGAAWLSLMRALDPDFDPRGLDLSALDRPPREHQRVRELKNWFRAQLVGGRRPRSLVTLLEEIGGAVARVQRTPSIDGVLGRFAGDLIASPGGFSLVKIDLRRAARLEGAAMVVEQDHFLDRVAVRLDPGARCVFAASGIRVMMEFHAHAWSGIAEIRLGDTTERLDLFSERPATRHFIRDFPTGFHGEITVYSGGDSNLLSDGSEVWLQRVFVLDDGDAGNGLTSRQVSDGMN